jgi:Rrf2 family iron-sulfur cluster assembly transcriptional regulator
MKGGVRCLTHDLWEETGRRIQTYLAGVTLADVRERRLGSHEAHPS